MSAVAATAAAHPRPAPASEARALGLMPQHLLLEEVRQVLEQGGEQQRREDFVCLVLRRGRHFR
jgi:hypothetical protein